MMKFLLFVLASLLASCLGDGTYTIRSFNMYGGRGDASTLGPMTTGRFLAETDQVQDTVVQIIAESIITVCQGVLEAEVYDLVLDRLDALYPNTDWQVYVGDYDQNNASDAGERMGFFYRADIVDVSELVTWQGDNDKFFRAPIYGRFQCSSCELDDFFIFGIHTARSTVIRELDALPAFYKKMTSQYLKHDDVLIAGDMNAGFFVTPDQVDASLVSSEPGFTWLVDNDVDSLTPSFVSGSLQRFLACNNNTAAGFEGEGRAVDVKTLYGLNETEAIAVSVLKPVEVFIKKN